MYLIHTDTTSNGTPLVRLHASGVDLRLVVGRTKRFTQSPSSSPNLTDQSYERLRYSVSLRPPLDWPVYDECGF